MLRLVQKFSPMYVLYLSLYMLLLFPLLNHARITGPEREDPSYIFYQSIFIIWVVLGGLWAQENLEHKSSSYLFLRTLPLGAPIIVRAKFLLIFASVWIFLIFQSGTIWLLTGNTGLAFQNWVYLAVLGNLCLILGGSAYVGIYRFGFARFGKILLLLWMLIFLSPVLLKEFLLPPLKLEVMDVLNFVTGLNWIFITLVGLPLFWMLERVSVRAFRRPCE